MFNIRGWHLCNQWQDEMSPRRKRGTSHQSVPIGEAERRSASNKQVAAQNSENEETGGWGCRYDREKDREKGKTGKQTQVNVTEEQIEREREIGAEGQVGKNKYIEEDQNQTGKKTKNKCGWRADTHTHRKIKGQTKPGSRQVGRNMMIKHRKNQVQWWDWKADKQHREAAGDKEGQTGNTEEQTGSTEM